MKHAKRIALCTVLATMMISLSACSNMTHRERSTAIGAGAGAIGGAVLTGGSAAGVVGGAVVGGVIGHEVGK